MKKSRSEERTEGVECKIKKKKERRIGTRRKSEMLN